jgi:hypothetical protein
VRGALWFPSPYGLPLVSQLRIHGVVIDGPKPIAKPAREPGPLKRDAIAAIGQRLADAFPPREPGWAPVAPLAHAFRTNECLVAIEMATVPQALPIGLAECDYANAGSRGPHRADASECDERGRGRPGPVAGLEAVGPPRRTS